MVLVLILTVACSPEEAEVPVDTMPEPSEVVEVDTPAADVEYPPELEATGVSDGLEVRRLAEFSEQVTVGDALPTDRGVRITTMGSVCFVNLRAHVESDTSILDNDVLGLLAVRGDNEALVHAPRFLGRVGLTDAEVERWTIADGEVVAAAWTPGSESVTFVLKDGDRCSLRRTDGDASYTWDDCEAAELVADEDAIYLANGALQRMGDELAPVGQESIAAEKVTVLSPGVLAVAAHREEAVRTVRADGTPGWWRKLPARVFALQAIPDLRVLGVVQDAGDQLVVTFLDADTGADLGSREGGRDAIHMRMSPAGIMTIQFDSGDWPGFEERRIERH